MICNGRPIEKHGKSFGMPYRIMVGLNGNGLLARDFEKASDVASHDVLNEFDSTLGGGGVKDLIVTWSNLVVTWKVRPQMGILS
jgi:hypothetical protein